MAVILKTDKEVQALKKPGKHSLGGNLYAQIGGSGSKSLVARVTDYHRRRRDIGLGSYPTTSLKEARRKVELIKRAVQAGQDPKFAVNPTPTPTFAELARAVHAERACTFRNGKHCAQWLSSLERYAIPKIGQMQVHLVGSAEVMDLLRPIWVTKPETARRVLQRVAAIVRYAIPAGYRESELPIEAIRAALPAQKRQVRHHPAIHWSECSVFYRKALALRGISAMALRFLILTAARSGEVRGATWAEIDFEQAVWTIPARRMKAGRVHRVPLSHQALSILEAMAATGVEPSEPIFPNAKGNQLSDTALSKVLKAHEPNYTVHGFRSTFKDWTLEATEFPDVLSEAALAHVSGNRTRAAYARSDLCDRRRNLMQCWADWVSDRQPPVLEN